VIVRIDEDRLLECGLADFVVGNAGKEFVAAVGPNDFEAKVLLLLVLGIGEGPEIKRTPLEVVLPGSPGSRCNQGGSNIGRRQPFYHREW
jgi:hypothetical protein